MAKKKAAEPAPERDYVERVYDIIDKEFGEGIIQAGTEIVNEKRSILSMGTALDLASGGGIESASVVGITGPEKSGKTTLALTIAASAQADGRRVFYGNVEHRLKKRNLNGIRGLVTTTPEFNVIGSRKEDKKKGTPPVILTAQQYLGVFEHVLKTVPGCVLIIDSPSAFLDEREQAGGLGTETRGGTAKLFSQWLRLVNPIARVNDCVVIGITHLICDTGNAMAGKVERVARAWKYFCDYQIRTKFTEPWKAGDKQIGLKINWLVKESSLNGETGNVSVQGYLRYGKGIDSLFELIQMAISVKLIGKAGAWYTLDYLGTDSVPKGQGGEGVYKLLINRPDWADALKGEVMKMAGCLVSEDSEDE